MAKKIKEVDITNEQGQIMTIKWHKDGVLFQIDDKTWFTDDPGEVLDVIGENGRLNTHNVTPNESIPSPAEMLLAAILLNRHEPLAPHHIGAIRELLNDLSDDQLLDLIRIGKWPINE